MKPCQSSRTEQRASRRESSRAHACRAIAAATRLIRVSPVLDDLIILPR